MCNEMYTYLHHGSVVHTGLLDALPFGPGPILPGPGEGNPADTSVGKPFFKIHGTRRGQS